MLELMWIPLASLVYFIGFTIAGAIERRMCSTYRHNGCCHPFDTPFPIFWPVALALGIITTPLWIPIWGGIHASRWLAARETPAERRERRAIERDRVIAEQKREIARLEKELLG